MLASMLSGGRLLNLVKSGFNQILDNRKRAPKILLKDILMSGYAMFSLKYPSLLQFDKHYREDIINHNLNTVFKIDTIPSDTQMRERLDEVDPRQLRPIFNNLFSQIQRSGKLSRFSYDNRYILSLDGTGYFNSKEVHCDQCCTKNHKDGSISYYHQMLSASIVHPDEKAVIPFCPEPIKNTDGGNKNDCERLAAFRFLDDFKLDHPKLKLIITGDGLFSNGPFIKRLQEDEHSFILVAKEGDHKSLFEDFNSLPKNHHKFTRSKIKHIFNWSNDMPINDTHYDCLVNVLEYEEIHPTGKKQRWVWVTDLELNKENVYSISRVARSRHKIENETFNTLKNQGYQFEHNFGHGKHNLTNVFVFLMMLAFFVDQLQQIGCKLFKTALERLETKKNLWERKRSLFFNFLIDSIESLWNALAFGHKAPLLPNSS